VVEVLERRVNAVGIPRLRCAAGWASECMTTGELTFVMEPGGVH
jgi:hypothetical protein